MADNDCERDDWTGALVIVFPEGFAWGTSTASYQIEGAVTEDGRAPSIWDTFSHQPGTILNGDTGDRAADHYHRYAEDVATLGWLGVQFYRFSLAWPRLQPSGRGPLNRRGADFYHRLLDELGKAGVRPWVTIYHWDLPQVLEDEGGWPARDTALRFADFAAAVHQEFGDRVQWWTTLNEPFCVAFNAYAEGVHAPGRTEPGAALAAGHHLLLAHGLAVERMRAARPGNKLGITLNLAPMRPASDAAADARVAGRLDARKNRFFLDPIFTGRYPDSLLDEVAGLGFAAHVHDGDLGHIAAPLDFLGVNFYRPFYARARSPEEVSAAPQTPSAWVACPEAELVDPGGPKTQMGWTIQPEGLHDLLTWLSREYTLPPLYLTENGMAVDDRPDGDGTVPDPERIAYLDGHLRAAHRAIGEGVDLRGYFVWSLLDNFEWAFGLERRFGLVYVDYPSGERIRKASAHWYRQVVRDNALPGTP
jgi:beta-glucosidase